MHNVSFMKKVEFTYLDNNATTACAPEVIEAMLPYFAANYGNASSTHFAGRQAFKAVETAREQLAELLQINRHELFFNSGATEGNNWIFHSLAKSNSTKKRIVVSAIEHKTVLQSARELIKYGFEVIELPVTSGGIVDLHVARELINDNTALVAVQFANNETGVIQPIEKLIKISHQAGAYFHCDAVQGLGKIDLDLSKLLVDSATFSAHKVHGPKGVGALFLRLGAKHWPWEVPVMGGGQEQGIRPGTLNVPGIVGFGKAAELIKQNLESTLEHFKMLQTFLENKLIKLIPGAFIYGQQEQRIANTTNVAIPGIPADILMSNLPLFCISNGSACDNGAIGNSHVLKAMGCTAKLSKTSIRISFCRYNKKEEVSNFINELIIEKSKLPHFKGDDNESRNNNE